VKNNSTEQIECQMELKLKSVFFVSYKTVLITYHLFELLLRYTPVAVYVVMLIFCDKKAVMQCSLLDQVGHHKL